MTPKDNSKFFAKATGKIEINDIFIYVTEKCNLNCDYCYFKDKRGRTLDFTIIKQFLDFLKRTLSNQPHHFIITGGEALLFKPLVKKTLLYIKKQFPGTSIGIQSNGTLLDKNTLKFLKKHSFGLELGIDGNFISVAKHRKNISKKVFAGLTSRIRNYLKEGGNIACSLTIHPDELSRLYDNFIFLTGLGLKKIDITPAAFSNWDKKNIDSFKKEYTKIAIDPRLQKNILCKNDVVFLKKFALDLSLHPPGHVFCGDVYLCLPEFLRKKYAFLRFNKGIVLNKEKMLFFIKRYRALLGSAKGATYRDYLSAGFKIVNEICGYQYVNSREIIFMHNFLKCTNLRFRRMPGHSCSSTSKKP